MGNKARKRKTKKQTTTPVTSSPANSATVTSTPAPVTPVTSSTENDPVSPKEYGNYVWNIIDSYFTDNRGLQSQAIASFNRFLKATLPSIVIKCGQVSVEDYHNLLSRTIHSVELTASYLEPDIILKSGCGRFFPLYPHEARNRNLTYSTPLLVDIRHTIKSVDAAGYQKTIKEVVHPKVNIAEIPIMVKSEFCRLNGLSERELGSLYEDPDDPGGYFIINGKEKVLVTQERPANNKLFLFKPMCDSKYQFECEMRSTVDSNTLKVSALWIHIPGNPKSFSTFKDAGRPRTFSGKKGIHSEPVQRAMYKQYKKLRPGLTVTIAMVRGTIPLMILFKALGFETDGEVVETLLVDPNVDTDFYEALLTTFEDPEARKVKTSKDALFYIGSKSIKEASSYEGTVHHARNLIDEEVLPALGSDSTSDGLKGYHIGYMVNRLIFAYLGRIHCDDRDHLQNKRFDLAGTMLTSLFKAQVKSLMNETRLGIMRRLNNGLDYDLERNIIHQKLITRGIIYAMTSGNWGDKRRGGPGGRVGVSQLLNRMTGMASVSYMRRINSPTNRLIRMTAPRHIHTTAFGYICPADTPEGETIGLLKALSVMAEISTDANKAPIEECLEELGYNSIEECPKQLATDTKIIIDSEILGTIPRDRVAHVLETLKQRRREYDAEKEAKTRLKRIKDPNYKGTYHGFCNKVSIMHDCESREIRIRTDSGRAYRPLLVVKDNQLVLTHKHVRRLMDPKDSYSWKNLIQDGVIEFLDPAESETAMIAMFPGDLDGSSGRHMTYLSKTTSRPCTYRVTYTHCEIHPSMILGVCASLIPFPDHNQSPRITYQTAMAKQAIGVYQTNFYYRNDTEGHVLHYPQRPLVTTKTAKFINYDDNPAGINSITAICCYSGYNQEDSVILNKTAVQRGFFRSTVYRVKCDEAKTCVGRGDTDEVFELPRRNEVAIFKSSYYMDLDKDGLPATGIEIKDNEPIIGKTQCVSEELRNEFKSMGKPCYDKLDVSQMFHGSPASGKTYVDSVMLTDNPDGYRMVKVKLRTPRSPQIGDKFASRHGQKGVMGMDFDDVDLPFTKDGIVPDIILNPHAIPSRMTIGHLLETVDSKRSSLIGCISDGTAFTKRLSADEIGVQLKKLGFHKHGMEVMYHGATGRKITNPVFIGPVFYQRLKHMTEDKIHIRSRGRVTALCKQPNAGLQKDGGLRFGEMERDSTISHGAASFLRERLFMVSDYYKIPVCQGCGNFLSTKSRGKLSDITHLKCKNCEIQRGAVTVELPYACKLFFQELMSMNIRVNIQVEDTSRGLPPPKPSVSSGAAQENVGDLLFSKLASDLRVENEKDDE